MMKTKRFGWLAVVVALICGSLLGSALAYLISVNTTYRHLRCLSTDQLVEKIATGSRQEKIDAAAIIGLERSDLREKHISTLLRGLNAAEPLPLRFQCLVALESMGVKARSAIPRLEAYFKLEREKMVADRIKDTIQAISTGAVLNSISGKIFFITGYQNSYEDDVLIARGFKFSQGLSFRSVFFYEFDRNHPSWSDVKKIEIFDYVYLDIGHNGKVIIINLPKP